MKELVIYYSIKIFGVFIRLLPFNLSLFIGKIIGFSAYIFDIKHKSIAYANLKMAFADKKSSSEIRNITKKMFINYGESLIELLRMPLMNSTRFNDLVFIEGKENIEQALTKGKGAILLAMHYGSWEIASLACAMLGLPYKMMVKTQKKYSKIDELLNSHRSCGGSIILTRGMGTRDMLKSLRNNEVIGMVADQGGKEGISVSFLGRDASMSIGAIKLSLKFGVPICFVVISREKSGRHKMIIEKPLSLDKSGDMDIDVKANLNKIISRMEYYIRKRPSEYMWFYKIWKYSKQAKIIILNDKRTGHLRQSQAVARMLKDALSERLVDANIIEVVIEYKSMFLSKIFTIISLINMPIFYQGRLDFLKWFLTQESFSAVSSIKADFIISCGSKAAVLNNLLSRDHDAKSIAILTPSVLSYSRFDKVILPRHDINPKKKYPDNIVITNAAPNVIVKEYLEGQSEKLLSRYSHLKERVRHKIGVFIGGNAKNIYIGEDQIKVLTNQLKEVAKEVNADILISTSRRTPKKIETMLLNDFKKDSICPLLIIANRENIPEAVGGILGLSDIVIVSGDSISMVSEAISAGKKTVVFSAKEKDCIFGHKKKHREFIDSLNLNGFVISVAVKDIGKAIYDVMKNKIYTKKINDNAILLDAMRDVI